MPPPLPILTLVRRPLVPPPLRPLPRLLSTTTTLLKSPRRDAATMGRQRSLRSMKVVLSEQQKDTNVVKQRNELGLLEETFIPPTGAQRPSLLKPLPYASFRLFQTQMRLRDWWSRIVYWYMNRKNASTKGSVRGVVPAAIALHNTVYTAFAAGDLATLRKNCCDGLYETMAGKIALRDQRGEKWQWKVEGARGKMVSCRAASFGVDGMGVRQVVVKLQGRQELRRWKNGVEIQGRGEGKDVMEYFVVQKRMIEGKEESKWMVWGTTGETTQEVVEAWEEKRSAA